MAPSNDYNYDGDNDDDDYYHGRTFDHPSADRSTCTNGPVQPVRFREAKGNLRNNPSVARRRITEWVETTDT